MGQLWDSITILEKTKNGDALVWDNYGTVSLFWKRQKMVMLLYGTIMGQYHYYSITLYFRVKIFSFGPLKIF